MDSSPETRRSRSANGRLAGICGLAAVGWAAAVPHFGGPRRTDYRHEAPASGNADLTSRAMRLVDFLPTGILASTFAELGSRSFDNRVASMGVRCFNGVGVGYATAAFAPGNPGGANDGTLRQAVHNGAGLFEYVSGAAGLILFGLGGRRSPSTRWLSRTSLIAFGPYSVVLAASGMTEQPETRRRLQRLLEGTLFAWMTGASIVLMSQRSPQGQKSRR